MDASSRKRSKQIYFEKIYNAAVDVGCACGCGTVIKNKDRFGRDKRYVSGHNGRKYDNPTQYKREWNHGHRKERYAIKVKRGRALKAKLIRQLGGKCSFCSTDYDGKNGAMFQFHHRDPTAKSFPITQGTLTTKRWKDTLVEVQKCLLLCANCHFLLHAEEF